MQEHWERVGPPVYIAVASYLGLIKPDKPAKASAPVGKKGEVGDLSKLHSMLSMTGGVLNG